MADDVVICAEGLGKKYLIGHQAERERYAALRDTLVRGAHNLWRKTADMVRGRAILADDAVEEFWALRDVSFEVKRGEVLGIIGRNGAGKTTLLKILSRITEPSEGRVTIKGRVASLLEVGTGFHPELTGRENIYLNGAILGMTRAEIRKKFDQIVAFAEVEKFLDTPVKRYSSGMYVRLAFAVAAHLEPEILVVDEVLAVGDAEFQKKCLGKMSEFAGGGRTVLFVSHNMGAVQALCPAALLLKRGKIDVTGRAVEVVAAYLNHSQPSSAFVRSHHSTKPTLVAGTVLPPDLTGQSICSDTLYLRLEIMAPREADISVDIRVKDHLGAPVGFGSLGAFNATSPVRLALGRTHVIIALDVAALANGTYSVSIDLTNPFVEFFDRAEDCLQFNRIGNLKPGLTRAFEQGWGYGSVALSLRRIEGSAIGPSFRAGVRDVNVETARVATFAFVQKNH
jgi:lipopolysaccharide transport system ATP-binding protein